MATTTKKGSENKRAKLRGPVVKTSAGEQAQTNAGLRQQLAEALEREKAALKKLQDRDQQLTESANELQDCQRRLTEALEQQTATGEILGVIASSPTNIQPVLDVVAEYAARLCDATDAIIHHRWDGKTYESVAKYGSIPLPDRQLLRPIRGTPAGRAIVDKQTIHVDDIMAEIETEFPESRLMQQFSGARTILATP